MGAGPLGALWAGYLADSVGPQNAIIISAGCMALLALIMGVVSPLWGSVTEQTAV